MVRPEQQDKAIKRVELPDRRGLTKRIFQRVGGDQPLSLWTQCSKGAHGMVAPLGTRPGSEQFSYHAHPDGWCRCRIIRRPVRSNRGPPRFGHVPVGGMPKAVVEGEGPGMARDAALTTSSLR